ncbi:XRE family transcriptional regulator [Salmonella enterica subsp. enterica serovar Mountpleasant]|nr:XRE family transcriptional regulator [Salmonella enterica subsp. enterica serovar Mountpleasant]
MKTLCERLKYAMDNTGVTSQSELSRLSGVNQSLISKILAGRSETSKFSGKLAAALGISADWLINGAGSMLGDDSSLQKVDFSRLITIWDENGKTSDAVSWPERLPDHYRAYMMKKNTGIAQAPIGAIVIVDPKAAPGNDELVVTNIKNEISVYRFLDGGAGNGFLSVDDSRIPVSPIDDLSCLVGVVEQILVRKLRK